MLKKYRNDLLIISIILIFAVFLILIINLVRKPGSYVVVIYDSKEVAKYDLNIDQTIILNYQNDDQNILEIKNKKAKIIEANCPDKLCVKNFGAISKEGESIVCLPHKIVIKIVGPNKEIDVVS